MDGSTIIWIVLAVVVVIIVVALLMSKGRQKRAEVHRDQAEQIRREAQQHDRELREREAHAEEAEAQARRARAEADERAAEAKRLEAEAERRGEHAHEVRAERDEQLRRADAHDPDVRTDKEGYRLDEDGNRIEHTYDRTGTSSTGTTGTGMAQDTVTRDQEYASGDGVGRHEASTSTDGGAGWVDQDGQPVNSEGAHAHGSDTPRSEAHRGDSS